MKKALPAAIALAGSLGFAAAANAVNVNHDGLGQVLLYPYYTVNDGNDTLINITNTTGQTKAVKVRFVESMNSQEVLDFNLYLSPYDVWVGTVTTHKGGGATLATDDTSCTVLPIPAFDNAADDGGAVFRNYQYLGASYKDGEGGPQGYDRTKTGHVEVIEMGVVDDRLSSTTFTPEAWAKHKDGVPADCGKLVNAWRTGGTWLKDPDVAMSAATGGLYGSVEIINVNNGTAISADAVALDEFFDGDYDHQFPGSILPNLNSGAPIIEINGVSGNTIANARPNVDAVSFVLQKETIANDYVTVSELAAATDWVVTFPTKSLYVNGWIPSANPADAGAPDSVNSKSPEPFTSYWTAASVGGVAGSACEAVGFQLWNREEYDGFVSTDDLDFSPKPDSPSVPPRSLCYEANVIGINGTSVLGDSLSRYALESGSDDLQKGWMQINFTGSFENKVVKPTATYDREVNSSAGYSQGLPAIGFSAIQIVNGDVGGILANYAGSTAHKATVTTID